MSVKSSDQIRQEFLDFFREKAHAITSSAPVVPADDPTLLFTNAGMNQFKAIFLGEEPGFMAEGKQWQRAANTQKCIRVSGKHNDLEEVGHDTYHHTLFEMLGNWSFGDYFKEEAIEWAWELLVDRWGLDPDRLYVTVFGGDEEDGLPADEEAAQLWVDKTGVLPEHVLKFGKKDNFWEMGETGPCGPCSEVHVDLRSDEERAKVDGATLVNADDPRVMEIWNLVFIQFNREASGKLVTLPSQHVDTGMGFERICAVIQGKTSNYDSDVFTPIINNISRLAGIPYGKSDQTDIAMRVIADHIRAVSFSVADGASPSNDGRGYVIRRILRRAVRYGWDKLGLKEPFMHKLVAPLADRFAGVFPELKQQEKFVSAIIRAEEDAFLKTLGQGIQLFESMIEGQQTLSGADAFKLHDTYGFPIDLTTLMAREKGIQVDEAGFQQLMKEQKERARAAGKFSVDMSSREDWHTVSEGDDSEFTGYHSLKEEVVIRSVRKEKDRYIILLDKTPFYAESGGQVGDTGILSNGDVHIPIVDVKKVQGRFYHISEQLPESLEGSWTATVDQERRQEIQKHHSATHLMHAALRRHLGTHVVQKGSLVEPDRLRFDFSHYEAVHADILDQIEREINEQIQRNIAVDIQSDVPIDEAREKGAMMLFGEKYGDVVRMVTVDPDYSVELCGGTHVKATGEIGYFRFLSESSAASGIRRVEAVAGKSADAYLREEKNMMTAMTQLIGPNKDRVQAIEQLIADVKTLEKELDRIKVQQALQRVGTLTETAREHPSGVQLITAEIPGAGAETLKQMGYELLKRKPANTVSVLGARDEASGKVYLVATVTDDLIASRSLKAGTLVGAVAKLVGGGGGGQPGLATAGGRFPEKLPEALDAVTGLL